MSPALFLLCMEYFSRLIKRNTTNSDFNFHPKCEKLKITYLFFADDLLLFSRGDLPSIHILMECLQEFRDVFDLAVNTAKSNIFTASIQNDTLDEALAMTEFARGNMPVRLQAVFANGRPSPYLSPAGWSLYVPLSREWSAFGSKSSLSQWQLLKRSTVCAGPSYGIPREHRWPGRIFAIRRRKAVWVSDISNPGMLLSLPESYGTFIARQTPYGPSGSMRFTSGGSLWDWQPKKGDSPLFRRLVEIQDRIITDFGSTDAAIQHMAEWTNSEGLVTSKAYEYFRPKLPRQL
ncbi:UNVERIFIED_CONTAM: hypothetical protein Sradi_0142800 [Sesamum radiatum]|uniref:Reverse transcriptase domain-containing protein n=1 Tax=Sesamum radiatum TaxID=300843 RepID=A0AAW2WJI2_SESRA